MAFVDVIALVDTNHRRYGVIETGEHYLIDADDFAAEIFEYSDPPDPPTEELEKDLTLNDLGTIRKIGADSSDDFIENLPSVNAGHINRDVEIIKLTTGKLTINANDSDVIEDSGAAGSIYCDDSGMAVIKLRLVTATKWAIVYATNSWTTTD